MELEVRLLLGPWMKPIPAQNDDDECQMMPAQPPASASLWEVSFVLTWWSRADDPDGAPVARAILEQGVVRWMPLGSGGKGAKLLPNEVCAARLAPASIGGATPGEPLDYLIALLSRFSGSYFWIEARRR